MTDAQSKYTSLETRVVGEVYNYLAEIFGRATILQSEAHIYQSQLRPEDQDPFAQVIRDLKERTKAAIDLIKILGRYYSAKEQGIEYREADRVISEDTILHDFSNILTVIIGKTHALKSQKYTSQLDSQNAVHLGDTLAQADTSITNIIDQIRTLQNLYRTPYPQATLVDASTLGLEETVYRLIHVDDNQGVRELVKDILTKKSNTQQSLTEPEAYQGIFAHNGRRVRYELISCENIEEALGAMNGLKATGQEINLVLTDREMPTGSGLDLFDTINSQDDKSLRASEYQHVLNIAMLTGGISVREAKRITQTYNTKILTKPFDSLPLEQIIYEIINPPQLVEVA